MRCARDQNEFIGTIDFSDNPDTITITRIYRNVRRKEDCTVRTNLMSTRRKFLFSCSALTTVTTLTALPGIGGLLDRRPGNVSLADLSFEKWAGQVDSHFRVHAAPGRVAKLKLVEARLAAKMQQHGRRPPPDANNEKFTLIFGGASGQPLMQETYQFEHDELGRFDLFIVPVFNCDPRITKYEAVFNRSRPIENQS